MKPTSVYTVTKVENSLAVIAHLSEAARYRGRCVVAQPRVPPNQAAPSSVRYRYSIARLTPRYLAMSLPAGVAIRLHPFRIGEPPERKEEGYAHIGSTSTRIASRYDTRCSRCGDTILTWTTVGTVAVP